MVTVPAAIGLTVYDVLNKAFEVVILLAYNVKIDTLAIIEQGLFPFHALCKGMDVVTIEKAHHRHAEFP
jgi:hypothetical protein